MMKHFKILLILLPLLNLQSVNAQNTFQKLIGGDYTDIGNCVHQTFDGGFIICGSTQGFDSLFSLIHNCLIKTDSMGNLEWTKVFVTGQWENIYSVQQTSDSGYIMVGYTYINSTSRSDILIIKTDAAGNPEWVKSVGNNTEQSGLSIKQTVDHGYILCGGDNNNSGLTDVDIIRLDSVGNIVWSKKYGHHVAQDIIQADNGDFVISGKLGYDYLFVMRIDSSGNFLWNKSYTGLGNPKSSFIKTRDNGFGLLGTTRPQPGGYTDFCFSRLDSAGNVQWAKSYGAFFDEYGYSAKQTSDGGFILAGNSQSLGASVNSGCLVKIDSSGTMQWVKSYGGYDNEEIYSVDETKDHGFIMTGVSLSFSSAAWDIYLIKTDSLGNSGCYDSTVTQFTSQILADSSQSFFQTAISNYYVADLSVNITSGGIETTICSLTDILSYNNSDKLIIFPNPTSGKLSFELTGEHEKIKFEIINSIGEIVQRNYSESNMLSEIDISGCSSGVYLLRLVSRNNILFRKIIVQ